MCAGVVDQEYTVFRKECGRSRLDNIAVETVRTPGQSYQRIAVGVFNYILVS